MALYKAVSYVLDRIQDMPDVRYYCGYGTQIFYELIMAESAWTGRALADVEAARKADLQPHYRKTEPRVIQLQDRLDQARQNCTCGGAHL